MKISNPNHQGTPQSVISLFLKIILNFIYLFLAVLDLCSWVGFSVVAAIGSYSLVGSQTSHCGGFSCKHGLQVLGASTVAASGLQSTGSVVAGYWLSCSTASGIFPVQGSNLCLLLWKADSSPWSHQRSPQMRYFKGGNNPCPQHTHTHTHTHTTDFWWTLPPFSNSRNPKLETLLDSLHFSLPPREQCGAHPEPRD